MFRMWICRAPDGDGGGSGGATGTRAGERIRAAVKDADTPERVMKSIADSFADIADDFDARFERKQEEVATGIRGFEARMQEVSDLIAKVDAKRTREQLKGRAMPHFEPLSKDARVDEMLRTFEGSDEVRAFQEACDDYLVVSTFARAAQQYGSQAGWVGPQHMGALNADMQSARKAMIETGKELGVRTTAMDTLTAGEGLEWVPTGFSADVWTKYLLATRVSSIFDSFTIPQRVGSFTWPVQTSDPVAYRVGQATDFTWTPTGTASVAGTSSRTFTPKVLGVRVHLSREFEEDAAFAIAPWIRGRMGIALAVGVEKIWISGDTSTTHLDYDVCATTATDVRTAWDGLRKMTKYNGNARVNRIGAALTSTSFAQLGAKMGVWAADPGDNVIIVGTNSGWQMMDMTGVKTITDYGQLATSVRGEIGQYLGRPIMMTGYMPDTTGGVVDQTAANNKFTQILMVNRKPIMTGSKRGATLDTWFNPFTQQLGIVATIRLDGKCLPDYTDSANTVVGDIYNLSLTFG